MTIRLNKVTRDLNVGITTVVEFLQKKGYAVESSPNAKITEEQYAELVKEFSKDKNLKKETEKFTQERQTKERGKATVAIEGFEDEENPVKIEGIPRARQDDLHDDQPRTMTGVVQAAELNCPPR